MAVVLLWKGVIAMTSWRTNFMTRIGMSVGQSPSSQPWFQHFDRFVVLFFSEALFVAVITGAIFVRSLMASGRFKIRPGRRY